MKIATWNVNSIRTRQNHVCQWLTENPVDVLCLQETKVVDEQFPRSHFEDLGYRLYVSGQKASCLLPPASSPTTRLPAAVPT